MSDSLFDNLLTDRRRWLLGSLTGGTALNLWGLLRAQAAAREAGTARVSSRIRSCVFIYYYGGPSHLETYDMKPDAPSSVRGEFNPVSSTVPGVQVCEHLPMMSKLMHKVAVVRSMHHTNRLHDSAGTETFTGRQGPKGDREEFSPIEQFYPCHGAVLSHLGVEHKGDVSHATLPWLYHNVVTVPCQGGGFLGRQYDPLLVAGDPGSMKYRFEMLQRPEGLSLTRITNRRTLLDRIDQAAARQATTRTRQLQSVCERAYKLLQSDSLRVALDIEREDATTRERYGLKFDAGDAKDGAAALAHGRNLRGQNLLLARRLVEAGVPFVNVQDFKQQGQNWDSHRDNFGQHRKYLLPQCDRALAAFLSDLDERGLLDSTLVVALGEFGRTPKINGNAGRDHWPDCYSILLAGGGIQGGSILGSSDRLGAYPDTEPVTPADLAATIYWRFGIDPKTGIHDQTGRPHRLADGQPMTSVFA